MKENLTLIGRQYKKEERDDIKSTINKWSENSLKPIEGELEKTQEEVKMIEAINIIIDSELKSLGIENYNPVSPDSIHILTDKVFKEKFPDFKGSAFFLSTNDVIYVNKDKTDTNARLFSTLLHEIIHHTSKIKFYADNDGGIYESRVGYRINSPWKKSERKNRLRGFNELMVDFTMYKILLRNQKLLEDYVGITKQDIQGPIYTYMHYAPILESIINKISINKNISSKEVFKLLERGQFENNIFALKDVESSFGDGSLEILSLLGTLQEEDDNNKLEEMIKEFFCEENELKRQKIRFKILSFFDKSKKDLQK